MSSLARRTLRTTAAAAGIAALGAGLAGTAMAAPAAESEAPAPETAPASQGLQSVVPLAGLPGTSAVPDLAELPAAFAFQGPALRTAEPSAQAVPVLAGAEQLAGQAPDLTGAPAPEALVPNDIPLPDPGSATSRTEIEADPSTLAQVGALSALDSARLFDGVLQAPADQPEPDTGGAAEAG